MDPIIESVEDARISASTGHFEIAKVTVVDGGVFDADLRPVLRALNLRMNQLWNFPLLPTGRWETLPGEHLYGGFYLSHFGHCLNESLGRLWALDSADVQPESVVYHSRQSNLHTLYKMLELLRIDLPASIVTRPLIIKRLIVPAQLHQLAHKQHGHARFYEWFRQKTEYIAPLNVEKVFVSRAGLGSPHARFAGEAALEMSLERAGFMIVRPETLSLVEQVAIYKSADILLFSEGSALHLYAMSSTKPQRVGMLLRRAGLLMQTHVAEATGNRLVLFDAMIRSAYLGRRGGRNNSITLLDFERLGHMLVEEGFIDQRRWIAPSPDDALTDYEERCRKLEAYGELKVARPES